MAITSLMVGAVVKRELAVIRPPNGDTIPSLHVTTVEPDADQTATAAWINSLDDVTDTTLAGNDTLFDAEEDVVFKVLIV
jgi:hypothetical protein